MGRARTAEIGLLGVAALIALLIPAGSAVAVPSGALTTVAVPGLPAGTSSVLANLAMVDAGSPGYITADRCSTLTPGPQAKANGNYASGSTAVANLSVVPVDPDGRFCIYNQSPVQLVADLQGAFAPASSGGDVFVPTASARLLDTRLLASTRPTAGRGSSWRTSTGSWTRCC